MRKLMKNYNIVKLEAKGIVDFKFIASKNEGCDIYWR